MLSSVLWVLPCWFGLEYVIHLAVAAWLSSKERHETLRVTGKTVIWVHALIVTPLCAAFFASHGLGFDATDQSPCWRSKFAEQIFLFSTSFAVWGKHQLALYRHSADS